MHVDAEPGAAVYVGRKHVGTAPLDVDVPHGDKPFRLRVVSADESRVVETRVARSGDIAENTIIASVVSGGVAGVVSVGAVAAFLAQVYVNGATGGFYEQEGASVILFGMTPYLFLGAAGIATVAALTPLWIAGETPPERVTVDVDSGAIRY